MRGYYDDIKDFTPVNQFSKLTYKNNGTIYFSPNLKITRSYQAPIKKKTVDISHVFNDCNSGKFSRSRMKCTTIKTI